MGIFGGIKEKIAAYADVYIKLFKVNFILRTSNVLSYLLFALISIFIMFCVILFVGFGLAELLTDAGLSRLASMFLVVVFYILLLLIFFACRRGITRYFSGNIIKVMTEGDEEEQENE
jgi:membrane-associated HD superfamily phosphohydrolase